jgi:hypothetical protein
MKRRLVCLAFALSSCLSNSDASLPTSDSEMRKQLAMAIAHHDSARLQQLSVLILDDVIAHKYVYGYDARDFIAEMPGQVNIAGVVPRLRVIAAMNLPSSNDDEPRMQLDSIAIANALLDLTRLRDPQATTLNMTALVDSRLTASAIGNLQFLAAWDATETIRHLATSLPATSRHVSIFIAALRFLSVSPDRHASDCLIARRFRPLYSECGEPGSQHSVAGCGELEYLADQLKTALRCE